MKKMKSFWNILLQRMSFWIFGGIIICLIVSSVEYMFFKDYTKNYFSDVFENMQKRVSKTAEEEPVSEIVDKVAFRLAVDAETSNGINYFYIEDEETGRTVANSDRGAFIVLRDRNTEEKAQVLRVDSKYLQPLNKYDNIDIQDRLYYFVDGDLTYLPTLKPEFYTIRVITAYRGEDKAYPGTIEVMGSADLLDDDETLIETITLSPENANDYQLVSRSDDYTILFIYVGSTHVPLMDHFSKETMDEPLAEGENSVVTSSYDGFFWPGRCSYFGKFRYVDVSGKSYIVHYFGELSFKDLAMYAIGINVLIMTIVIIVALISARKQYNREKYQYSLIAYQNNLIDVMAHDLRTPLMAMSGYAENLKEEANAEKRDYYIDAIMKNTDHMSQIISRNLELTRIGTEEVKKNYKKIDLVEIIKGSLDGYNPIFEKKKITVNTEGNLEIKGDEALMKTAMDNIASNLVKYVNEGGAIDITARGKVLTISNTTTENIKNPAKLWDPFVRGDESRSNQGGTGLGLAIARGVFVKHKLKSRISVAGGRFIIELKK